MLENKQIIIDGVDVSGCIVFNDKWGTPLCNPTEDIREAVHCSDNPNCLYKKYKRKEQECKDLRENIKDIANLLYLDTGEEYNFGNIELEIKQLKAKEQECEELKDKLNCCFCNPHVELNDIEKQRKCVEVTECFRRQLDQFEELYNYYAFDRRKPENITELKICINGVNEELIRLQQENEELKAELELFKTSNQTTMDQLKAENEELKKANDEKNELLIKLGCPTTATAKRKVFYLQEQIDQLKAELEDFQDNCEGCSTCNEALYNAHLYAKECRKLKQTLAEIKKLVEKEFCRHPECCEFCANSNDCLNQKIIEKINEVEE